MIELPDSYLLWAHFVWIFDLRIRLFHLLWAFDWRREEVFKEQKSLGVVKSLDSTWDNDRLVEKRPKDTKTRVKNKKNIQNWTVFLEMLQCFAFPKLQLGHIQFRFPSRWVEKPHTFFHSAVVVSFTSQKKRTFVLHALLGGMCQLYWFHRGSMTDRVQLGVIHHQMMPMHLIQVHVLGLDPMGLSLSTFKSGCQWKTRMVNWHPATEPCKAPQLEGAGRR